MKKIIAISLASFMLNGCVISGPLALLPSSAKYLLMQEDSPAQNASIPKGKMSVADLLAQARNFENADQPKEELRLYPYEGEPLSHSDLGEIANSGHSGFELVCGPMSYGLPETAVNRALSRCMAIAKELGRASDTIRMRFDQDSLPDTAILKPLPAGEAKDA